MESETNSPTIPAIYSTQTGPLSVKKTANNSNYTCKSKDKTVNFVVPVPISADRSVINNVGFQNSCLGSEANSTTVPAIYSTQADPLSVKKTANNCKYTCKSKAKTISVNRSVENNVEIPNSPLESDASSLAVPIVKPMNVDELNVRKITNPYFFLDQIKDIYFD